MRILREEMQNALDVIRIACPAKVNLWLQVVRKRPDGYHDIWSLMLPVDIYDELEFSWHSQPGVHIFCDHPYVPRDRTNILWKAYEIYRKRTGWPDRGVKVVLKKNIPVGAGLGGGSSNGAAMLEFLNNSNPSPCLLEDLLDMAREVGADVPFFLISAPATAEGIGEKLTIVENLPNYPLLLIKPPFEVSTETVYKSLRLTEEKAFISIKALLQAPWDLKNVLINDLEAVTVSLYPEVDRIKEWLIKDGALGAVMSGSGPTVFGVFDSEERAEEALLRGKERWGNSYWMRVCQVLSQVNRR
ncbi:MAG: 4-(cytidine 5'-diphospho)-2-C-methyl-D-erythritol kinase [Thermodesulforhabdaceae bacterium]